MWIKREILEGFVAAQREQNNIMTSYAGSLAEASRALTLLADMIKRMESTTNTRLDGVERTLTQYALSTAAILTATDELVKFRESLELRTAALQFTANQLTKFRSERETAKKPGGQDVETTEADVGKALEGEAPGGPGYPPGKQHGRKK